jgi:outer membrane protein assembly factor BamD
VKKGQVICALTLGTALLAGCLGKKNAAPAVGTSAEPDKVLYEKATNDLKHGRYTTGRLALETLINTYPDSEYLAKAKLSIGDSYYKEGGTAGLKQAIVEYQDFRTFFPFLDEAAYAQMQIALAHYRQMEKPDRDRTEAVQAEAEFQTFLEKYPNSPLLPQAEQDLRNVQEVLAEGNFRVADFYYLRGAYRAAGARLMELTDRYPLYSQADQANWMLGQIWEKSEHNDLAAKYYARIVKDYPLSSLAGDAKNRLVKFGVPVPPADPTAVARMQKEQEAPRASLVKRGMGLLKNSPDVSAAARSGAPTMTPASETGDETIGMALQQSIKSPTTNAIGNTAAVETITPGSPNALPNPPENTSSGTGSTPTASDATPAATDSTQQPASSASSTDTGASQSSTPASSTDSSNAQSSNSDSQAQPANSNQESSSKKKSGLRKLIPF